MSDSIQHIIVLMLENRSFDHFFGALPNVDGVDPNNPRFNLEGPDSTTKYQQEPGAVRKMKPDAKHETKNVLRQINPDKLGRMGGFIYDFAIEEPHKEDAWKQVMAYFELDPVDTLPAAHQLAKSFCVMDPWFSSVPGPTWTNRFFVHSGTSQGWVNMPDLPHLDLNLHKYDQTTVYDRLNERNISWRIYAGDIPQSLLLYNQRKPENRRNYHRLGTFFSDVAEPDASRFPSYAFIEPNYLPFGQNDQHPPHDVLKGDELIASVYNAVRANEALWESTLLIVLWDEHGGFYDHVYPPPATPPDHNNQEGFDFRQYGVRVPAMLISKWVTPGSVFQPQSGVLDHTSILKYLTEKFSLGPLLNRVASAASLAGALVTTANDASPEIVGLEPKPLEMTSIGDEVPDRLNLNQKALIEFSKHLELEMSPAPEAVGLRAMRARTSLQSEIEVAKERTWLFIEQPSQ
jgi:phospholipase C